jgi:hypothetical protein
MDPDWLRWVKRLASIAQDGLTYATDGYDLGRYEQLREVAVEVLASHSTGSIERARKLLELETGPAIPKVDVRAAVFQGAASCSSRSSRTAAGRCRAAGPTSEIPRPGEPSGRYTRSRATGCGQCV